MRVVIIFVSVLLLFGGCNSGEDKHHDSKPHIDDRLKVRINNKNQIFTPVEEKKKKTAMESMGISMDGDKIIIDTKQTKGFFIGVGEKIKGSFKEIERSLRKDQVKSSDETGIFIDKDTIRIDINRTKNFIEKWTNSMESVINELDKTAKEIEEMFPDD